MPVYEESPGPMGLSVVTENALWTPPISSKATFFDGVPYQNIEVISSKYIPTGTGLLLPPNTVMMSAIGNVFGDAAKSLWGSPNPKFTLTDLDKQLSIIEKQQQHDPNTCYTCKAQKTAVAGDGYIDQLMEIIPGIRTAVAACPVKGCNELRTLYSTVLITTIIHLNDFHHWPREDIADWLDTLPFDLTIKEQRGTNPEVSPDDGKDRSLDNGDCPKFWTFA